VFESVRQTWVYQKVADQIEEAILSDRLKAGDRLPPERSLTGVFQTSRRTLREALRVLEQKGLVEIKTGSKGGAFITDRSSDRMRESLTLLIRKKKIPYESLVEFRFELEGAVAALAAERATPEDLAALKDLLLEAGRVSADGLAASDRFNSQETALHLQLGRICKNPLYEAILRTIHEVLVFPSFKFLEVDEPYILEASRDWSQIVKAIEKRQSVRARTLMQGHLEKFSRYHSSGREVFDGEGWRILAGRRTAGSQPETNQRRKPK
jgi:GntR family transcriptional repressor for pyruvate dehydrogenase complex